MKKIVALGDADAGTASFKTLRVQTFSAGYTPAPFLASNFSPFSPTFPSIIPSPSLVSNQKKALDSRSPYYGTKYIFLDFLEMSFAVLPVSDCVCTPFALRPQHRKIRPQHGTPAPPLPVICVRLVMMSRMNSMLFSTAHPHTVSLCRKYESLFSEARAQDVFSFLHHVTPKVWQRWHHLSCTMIVFYEQASSHTL
jgi:hypothetical protein